MFFNLSRKSKNSAPEIPQIPAGAAKYEVSGCEYRQEQLRKLYKKYEESTILFTLTPRSRYQVTRNWSEMPFVNVNIAGSTGTTEKNWLGYVRTSFFSEADLTGIVRKHGPVSVYGKITKKSGEYSIVLTIAETSDVFESSITYSSSIIPEITKIADKTFQGWVSVRAKRCKTPKGFEYRFYYAKSSVGPLSMKKSKELDEWLNGRGIISARLGIATFRQQRPQPYTKIVITPDIV